jgi:hypothetical protein
MCQAFLVHPNTSTWACSSVCETRTWGTLSDALVGLPQTISWAVSSDRETRTWGTLSDALLAGSPRTATWASSGVEEGHARCLWGVVLIIFFNRFVFVLCFVFVLFLLNYFGIALLQLIQGEILRVVFFHLTIFFIRSLCFLFTFFLIMCVFIASFFFFLLASLQGETLMLLFYVNALIIGIEFLFN